MKNPRRGRGNPLRDDTFRQQEMACVQTIRISPAKTDAVKVPKRAEPCGRAGYVPGLNAIALLATFHIDHYPNGRPLPLTDKLCAISLSVDH